MVDIHQHPGNMIVDRNKSVRGQPLRIHMIDCGLTVELGERDHVNMVKILGSLIKRDGYAAGKLMVDTAKKCQATELDVELFCRGIDKIVEDDEDNVSVLVLIVLLVLFFSILREHPIHHVITSFQELSGECRRLYHRHLLPGM